MAVSKSGSRKKFEWGINGESSLLPSSSPNDQCSMEFYKNRGEDGGNGSGGEMSRKSLKPNLSCIKINRTRKPIDSREEMMSSFRYCNGIFMGSTPIQSLGFKPQRTIGVETEEVSHRLGHARKLSCESNDQLGSPNFNLTISTMSMSRSPFEEFSSPLDAMDSADFFTSSAPADWLMPGLHCTGSFNGLFFTS